MSEKVQIRVEVPEETVAEIDAEAEREMRTRPEQASYLLLLWAREAQKRAQAAQETQARQAAFKARPNGGVHVSSSD